MLRSRKILDEIVLEDLEVLEALTPVLPVAEEPRLVPEPEGSLEWEASNPVLEALQESAPGLEGLEDWTVVQ
jgi:hypothetical protein